MFYMYVYKQIPLKQMTYLSTTVSAGTVLPDTKNADRKITKRKMYSNELHVEGTQFSMETDVIFEPDDKHLQSEYFWNGK